MMGWSQTFEGGRGRTLLCNPTYAPSWGEAVNEALEEEGKNLSEEDDPGGGSGYDITPGMRRGVSLYSSRAKFIHQQHGTWLSS